MCFKCVHLQTMKSLDDGMHEEDVYTSYNSVTQLLVHDLEKKGLLKIKAHSRKIKQKNFNPNVDFIVY